MAQYNRTTSSINPTNSSEIVEMVVISDGAGGIVTSFGAGGGGGTSTQRTPSYTSVNSSGTVAAGAKSVSIANVGAAVGTVLGTSIAMGVTLSWDAPPDDTLAAIAYNATGTTFLILTVV